VAKPFLPTELFEINDILDVHQGNIGRHKYLYIDNFYKRPKEIYKMLKESWHPNWKIDVEGRNFVDYYDCRTEVHLSSEKTINFLKDILNNQNVYCEKISFNIFSWINKPNKNIQFLPHTDYGQKNVLVYLDKSSSGGTAFYEEIPNEDEYKDIRYDITGLEKHVIPAKFNRCVIFDGSIPHGGYIEDHSKYSNGKWRYNAVYFVNHG